MARFIIMQVYMIFYILSMQLSICKITSRKSRQRYKDFITHQNLLRFLIPKVVTIPCALKMKNGVAGSRALEPRAYFQIMPMTTPQRIISTKPPINQPAASIMEIGITAQQLSAMGALKKIPSKSPKRTPCHSAGFPVSYPFENKRTRIGDITR